MSVVAPVWLFVGNAGRNEDQKEFSSVVYHGACDALTSSRTDKEHVITAPSSTVKFS